jgi:hypothetical protein
MSQLITIDNGGTLTDVCVIDGERVTYTKTLTTPHDLSRCLFDGLDRVAGRLEPPATLSGLLRSADNIRYSTTQGTNALVQRVGPGGSPKTASVLCSSTRRTPRRPTCPIPRPTGRSPTLPGTWVGTCWCAPTPRRRGPTVPARRSPPGSVDASPSKPPTAPWGLVSHFTAAPDGISGAFRIMVVPRDTDPDAVAAAVRSWRGQ